MIIKYHDIIGISEFYNPCNLNEIIFKSEIGSISIPIHEAYIQIDGEFIKMTVAFRKKIIKPDRYKIRFSLNTKEI